MAAGDDPGGALVVLCQGHRCAALHRLADDGAAAATLSAAVGESRGAVLITTDCLGQCSLGALAGVAHRDGGTGRVSATVWLSGAEQAGRAAELRRWIAGGGPPGDPRHGLPAGLRGAVAGFGPPPVVRPG